MAEHARLSPSDAGRWLLCPGAINLCDKLKVKDRGNEHAALGTFAHTVREICLEFGLDAYNLIGFEGTIDGFDFVCDDDMAEHLQPGIDRIRQFPGKMTVEYRVDLGSWMPGQFGTLDCGIAGDDLIVISDLKYGMGVIVEAVGNLQQQIYALGFWDNVARHLTKAKEFLIIIDQPRVSGQGGEWRVSLEELIEFGKTLKSGAEATKDPNAPRCASSHACHWCPAAKIAGACPEHEAFVMSIVALEFDDLDQAMEFGVPPTLPSGVTPERRSFILQNRHVFTKWLDNLHDQALEDAIRGVPVPDLKAVAGRSMPRKYGDKDEAIKLLERVIGEEAFKKVPLTPSQIEKKFGEKVYTKIARVVTQGDPKPQLVSKYDAREALVPLIDKFDIIPDDDLID